jgi:hypothetical protein
MSEDTYDDDYDNWQVGDVVIWEEDRRAIQRAEGTITEIDKSRQWVWFDVKGESQQTRAFNLLRFCKGAT